MKWWIFQKQSNKQIAQWGEFDFRRGSMAYLLDRVPDGLGTQPSGRSSTLDIFAYLEAGNPL